MRSIIAPADCTKELRRETTGLVIDVDGDIHDLQKEEDERREKVLREMGLRIVRFGNDEVMRSLSAVVRKIRETVGTLSSISSNRGKIQP